MSRRSKDITKSLRFLQVSKLIRTFKPVTINGVATKAIIKEIKEKETDDPDYFKSYKNYARLSFLQKYLLEYIKNNPDGSIYLSLVIKPSDPDFPFDLEKLKFMLTIPTDFPEDKEQRPKIAVLNEEIPRGFAYNIEAGFQRIVSIAQCAIKDEEIELVEGIGLTSLVMTLDKYLEVFLKQEKKETIKFVKTKKKQEKPKPVEEPKPKPQPKSQPPKPKVKPKVSQQVLKHRRQLIDEMCYKLDESVSKFRDDNYKVTIPMYKTTIPELWKLNGSIDLMVSIPENYPEEPLKITFRNNFNENLIIKFCENEDQFEMVKIIKQYKNYERNITSNVKSYDFGSDNLVVIINGLTNNLDQFILDEPKFDDYLKTVKSLQVM
ncbi:hypothetical protein SBY92_002236 [Candida maltosa Xu316]|uniref:Uncharacterized protein n=1 Tax=Candida maltosa (strain Xu316) TaxID=1245528 RepID=M3HF06_CANMX|nr:hypothetical protein G210_3961 [Candida maltosa Xu316]